MHLPLELTELTRKELPGKMPLFVRMSTSGWMEHRLDLESWDVKQATVLAKALVQRGKGFADVSSGELIAAQKISVGPSHQAPFLEKISLAVKESSVAVDVIGMATSGKQAEELLAKGIADAVKGFMKNSAIVWSWVEKLGVDIPVANQIGWAFRQKAGRGILEQ